MRDHPILFSAPMVRQILADRKSVTRRLSPQWRKVKAGDRLWVRETWCRNTAITRDRFNTQNSKDILYRADCPDAEPPLARVLTRDRIEWIMLHDRTWKPSIHMPRWASRILLECEEDTRPERLQDITEQEAEAEGVEPHVAGTSWGPNDAACIKTYRTGFVSIWQTLHTKAGERWEDNPTVYRVGRFHRVPVRS